MKIQTLGPRLFLALLLVSSAAASPAAESLAELTEQVRVTEVAFAKTLADRDIVKFRAMIAPDVIWLGDEPLRGPAAVVESWKGTSKVPTRRSRGRPNSSRCRTAASWR